MKARNTSDPVAHQEDDRELASMPSLRLYIGANLRLRSELESWRLNLFKIVWRAAEEY